MSGDKYMRTTESFEKVVARFRQDRACAVLRTVTADKAAPAMNAAIEGGFKLVEFTLTTPNALDRVAEFRAKYDGLNTGNVLVGCGTVLDIQDCMDCLDAGSEFLVAPVLVPEVVSWCRMHNVVIIPGCQTPSEAYAAYKAGAPSQKIFPGVAGGAAWIKAVSSALPMLKLNPTSGVDLDNAGEFIKAGATSVGLVAPLFPPAAVAGNQWDVINANAVKVIGNIKTALA